jgi:glycosyltransferase involved in cell wall biosynthesis
MLRRQNAKALFDPATRRLDTPSRAGRGTVAFVLKGYPRLSETFIAQEIHALERLGLRVRVYALRRPTDGTIHPVHREIAAPVAYLPEYLVHEPLRVLRGWRRARRRFTYRRALRAWLGDLLRDPTANRIRRFGQACVLVAELPADIVRLHAHFLHTPASVARYASLMTGMPWSCSAHAKDIWTTPEWDKRQKLAEVEWLATCTKHSQRHLRTLAPFPDKVVLAYHGLDFDRLPRPGPRPARDGAAADDPVTILSVGRAVEKKGYIDLLMALARLSAELSWRFVHIGGGELLPGLRRRADALGLFSRTTWMGPQPQDIVIESYRRADLFALASRVARDGDRDGLPNVLMEAQSQGLACLSTSVSAIPELIDHGVSGLLVPSGDIPAMADALELLIRRPDLREQLGVAGAHRVRCWFCMQDGISTLAEQFGLRKPDSLDDVARCASHSTPR